jgi:nucleotide-binding universal stress UspA family protein
VLCAIDGTAESLASVRQAATLAGPRGELTLLVVTSFRHESDRRSPAIPPARASEIVEQSRRIAEAAGVSATVEVDPAGPPAKVVLRWAAERDLLAIGVPATSWFGAMFMGGVAATAEDLLTTPLLVTRVTRLAERPDSEPPHIVVASDGLEGSDALVDLAGRLADDQGGSITLVHALGPESRMHPHRIQHQAERLQTQLGSRAELQVVPGHARHVVIDAARECGASLIVLSSRRLTGLHAVGSVSRRVIHQAHCSVLLVPPESLDALEADAASPA